jgi:hypothetical protein
MLTAGARRIIDYGFGQLDPRPIALFRIAFGLLLLKEALYHLPYAHMLYSDEGVLPWSVFRLSSAPNFSVFQWIGNSVLVQAVFVLWALVALGLIIGWRTRLLSILNFVLVISVVHRYPLFSTGADLVMMSYSWWMIFIPLDATYRVRLRRPVLDRHIRTTLYAFPVRMLQISVALVYLGSGIYKLQGASWQSGEALFLALQLHMHTFPWAADILTNIHPILLQFATWFAMWAEVLWPLLVFFPVGQPRLKIIGLVLGVLLHIGIGSIMNVPNFPLVMLIGYLPFFEPRWIDWLEQRPLVRSLLRASVVDEPRTEPGCLLRLGGTILNNTTRIVMTVFLGGVMTAVIWAQILQNDGLGIALNIQPMPTRLEMLLVQSGLWQSYPLFAPNPRVTDAWLILRATTADGTTTDLRTGLPPSEQRVQYPLGFGGRWGKLEEQLFDRPDGDPIFPAWIRYACAQDADLTRVEFVFRYRLTVPQGQPLNAYAERVKVAGECER